MRLLRFPQVQGAVFDEQLLVRRNHVDVVRQHFYRLFHLTDRHRGLLLNDLGEIAFDIRRQVHHDHEGKPAFRIHLFEKLLEHRHSAGRGPEAHHRRRLIRVAAFGRAIARIRARIIGRRGIGRRHLFFGHELREQGGAGMPHAQSHVRSTTLSKGTHPALPSVFLHRYFT